MALQHRLVFTGLVLALAALLFVGCLGGAPEQQGNTTLAATQNTGAQVGASTGTTENGASGQGGLTTTKPGLVFTDPEMKEFYEAALQPEPKATTTDKLDEAFLKKEISLEEYALYSLQVFFEPSEVPSEYAGEQPVVEDLTDELMLAYENWDSFSQETKDKMRDWVFGRDEAGVTEIDIEKAVLNSASKISFSGRKAFFAPGWNLYSLQAIPGKVRIKVWMPADCSQAELVHVADQMRVIKQAMNDAWDKYKAFYGFEPSDEVILFVDKLPAGVRGSAARSPISSDPVDRCRLTVDVNNTGEDKQTKSTSVHELFHCFQYYLPFRNFTNTDERWLREATAKWSEHFVYPDYNKEHSFLGQFFETRNWKWVDVKSHKYYADYPFFLFLQQARGEDSIAKVLKDAKSMGVKGALKSINEYEDAHAEYSVWNWNKDPILRYKDSPSFPDNGIVGGALIVGKLDQVAQYDMVFQMQPGAASYQVLEVSGDDIKKIKFSFPDKDNKQQQRRALIKIGDVWTEEYWSPLEEKTFCLDRPSEKVDKLVVVYSNSDLDALKKMSYKIDTTGECPFEISGATKITLNVNAGEVKQISGTLTSSDVLEYYEDEYGGSYKIKSRSVSCTFSEHSVMDFGEYGITTMTRTGGGSTSETYSDLAEAPSRIRFDYEDNEIDFFVKPDTQNPEWAAYNVHMRTVIPGLSSSEAQDAEKGVCNVFFSDDTFLELDSDKYFDGSRLKGVETLTSEGGSTNTRLEFDYVLTQPP